MDTNPTRMQAARRASHGAPGPIDNPALRDTILLILREVLTEQAPVTQPAGRTIDGLASGAGDYVIGGLTPWQMREVTRFIHANIEQTIRVPDLAAAARLSTGHFTRTFGKSSGRTPHDFIRQQRVERAKAMMVESEEPLGQISVACGFADQPHFSRVFRQIVGRSPLAWRRQARSTRALDA